MDVKSIETLVTSYIEQSIQGMDKENPKFDFKAFWYDLKSPKDTSEFLKDTTSIVNTYGPDGFIVIGFDDRKKEYTQATFSDSKLRDTSDLINLINGKVDRLFTVNTIDIIINNNKLSIIHIPPSIDKPHVIKRHLTFDKDGQQKNEEENKIFVRKNSRVISASKYDIELMYYDRKNIEPDYDLRTTFHLSSTVFSINIYSRLVFSTYFTIENSGRRPIAISRIKVKIEFGSNESIESFTMTSDTNYLASNLIIKSGEISNTRVALISDEIFRLPLPGGVNYNMKQQYYNQERQNIRYTNLEITTASGDMVYSDLKMIQ